MIFPSTEVRLPSLQFSVYSCLPFLKKIGVIFPFFQALVNSLDHYDSSNRMEKCLATTSGSWMHVIRSYKLVIQLH